MQGLMALLLQSLSEPVGDISAVSKHPLRFWQFIEKGCRARVVGDPTGSYEVAEWPAIGIGQRVQLCIHASFGASDHSHRRVADLISFGVGTSIQNLWKSQVSVWEARVR